jgi:hypothetical protein
VSDGSDASSDEHQSDVRVCKMVRLGRVGDRVGEGELSVGDELENEIEGEWASVGGQDVDG